MPRYLIYVLSLNLGPLSVKNMQVAFQTVTLFLSGCCCSVSFQNCVYSGSLSKRVRTTYSQETSKIYSFLDFLE